MLHFKYMTTKFRVVWGRIFVTGVRDPVLFVLAASDCFLKLPYLLTVFWLLVFALCFSLLSFELYILFDL